MLSEPDEPLRIYVRIIYTKSFTIKTTLLTYMALYK